MKCNKNYLADDLSVWAIKDLILMMRFQSPQVYKLWLGWQPNSLWWEDSNESSMRIVPKSCALTLKRYRLSYFT